VTKPFSLAYKKKMVERMTGRDAVSARALSRETGVTQTTLSRWREEARSLPVMAPRERKTKGWSVEDKVRILSEAKDLTGRELAVYLEREGVLLAQLEQWRLALEEEGVAPKAVAKRIRALERELARKEKALAEAAALLILKKKVAHLVEDGDDDTDEENES
jgi:transposase